MKRTLIDRIPYSLPDEIVRLTEGVSVWDSSCSPEASVYFIDRDGGYYLKLAEQEELRRESELTKYFHSLNLGAELLSYGAKDGRDYMLTARVPGEDCIAPEYLSDPKRLCDTVAAELRALHEYDFSACPAKNKIKEYLSTAWRNYETDNYDKSHFPDNFGYRSAEEAARALREGSQLLCSDTLVHGDYCLPNIMLDSWRPSGFIDVGAAGIGDRHIDLFWGAWSLGFNLGTDEYRERFFDVYGRDLINPDVLLVVAAAEVFR